VNKRTIIKVSIFIGLVLLTLSLPISARWESHDAGVVDQTGLEASPR
jgi:hypothetical protein